MEHADAKDRVFADYASWMRSLLGSPGAFYCYDRRAQLFWRDRGGLRPALSRECKRAVRRLLRGGPAPAEPLSCGEHCAQLVPLRDARDQLHGALLIVAPARSGNRDLAASLAPAIRTLQRELALRYQLLESRRRVAVQAAEEKLLHHIDALLRESHRTGPALAEILRLCRLYLGIERAALVIDGRGIRLLSQAPGGPADAGESLDTLLGALQAQMAGDDLLSMPVDGPASAGRGWLLLQGWRRSNFSAARARRVARFIVSRVHAVLERETDLLTGLPVFNVFESRLAEACNARDAADKRLMYLDIDQLHVINENYGRDAGDELLQSLARLLRTWFGSHPVTRISSDSFAALLEDLSDAEAQQLAEDTCRRFHRQVFTARDKRFRPSVSIGIAPLVPGEHGPAASLAAAQVACRAAKDRGAGRVEVYQQADQSIVQRLDDIQRVGSVRDALSEDRLVLLAQPIFPLKPGRALRYCEVLVRMLGDDGELLPPAEFLSAAERYQLMEEVDRRVVRLTLQALVATGHAEASGRVRVAINLSGQSLGDERFLDFVRAEIEAHGVAPQNLCFEITETVAVAHMQRAQAFMHSLRRLGCRFSLDDFGTGLSSFSYLKLFPVDTLKIDGSFVRDVATNVVSQSVVAALSEVARVMQLETVAEYVQDEQSLELLRSLGVTWGQGYLLGEPARLEDMLTGERASTAESAVARQSL